MLKTRKDQRFSDSKRLPARPPSTSNRVDGCDFPHPGSCPRRKEKRLAPYIVIYVTIEPMEVAVAAAGHAIQEMLGRKCLLSLSRLTKRRDCVSTEQRPRRRPVCVGISTMRLISMAEVAGTSRRTGVTLLASTVRRLEFYSFLLIRSRSHEDLSSRTR